MVDGSDTMRIAMRPQIQDAGSGIGCCSNSFRTRLAPQVVPVKILGDDTETLPFPDGSNFHLFDDSRFGVKGKFLFLHACNYTS